MVLVDRHTQPAIHPPIPAYPIRTYVHHANGYGGLYRHGEKVANEQSGGGGKKAVEKSCPLGSYYRRGPGIYEYWKVLWGESNAHHHRRRRRFGLNILLFVCRLEGYRKEPRCKFIKADRAIREQ